MLMHRLHFLALSCSLLAPACGPGGGGDSDSPDTTTDSGSTETAGQTGSTQSPTEAGSTTETGSTTDASGTPTSEGGTETTATTTLDTDGPDETTTTGEAMPGPCDDVPAPDPANKFKPLVFLKHVTADSRFYLDFNAADINQNSVRLTIEFGSEEPAVGVHEVSFTGEVWIGESGGGASGTATIELVTLTEECVAGIVSEVVAVEDDEQVLNLFPGGFVGERVTL
ncbi:hypothetical protein [Nannocystis radixulma]|uniref:Lipoprotein n=1 Tax=Nannocystis radixulma TaxID=2995305 RepID=A0ABT5B3I7_9BACT|nr:hypothetical protein [Nannocystis radixulma]MDC0668672.1 hypothetical protein [Nannocystis radixulma]